MDLFAELVALASAFDAAAVEYALCGGLALALAVHGAPRATRDIDVMAREPDLRRLRECARACGFTIEALPMTLAASGVSIRFTKTLPGGAPLMLDVLLAEGAADGVGRPGRFARSPIPRACGSCRARDS